MQFNVQINFIDAEGNIIDNHEDIHQEGNTYDIRDEQPPAIYEKKQKGSGSYHPDDESDDEWDEQDFVDVNFG